MELDISTPALLFSAITLLMLAYTNRFLAISSIVRQFVALYAEKKEPSVLKQIEHFKKRLSLIKYTQLVGGLSFFFCVLCMFFIFFSSVILADVLFIISMILLMVSLLLSVYEIFISIDALNMELDKLSLKEEKKRRNLKQES